MNGQVLILLGSVSDYYSFISRVDEKQIKKRFTVVLTNIPHPKKTPIEHKNT